MGFEPTIPASERPQTLALHSSASGIAMLLKMREISRLVAYSLASQERLFSMEAKQEQRGGRSVALPIIDLGARRGWMDSATCRPFYTRDREQLPICKRLGGPQGRSGWVRKISPSSGFEPLTFQPVEYSYTASAIPTAGVS